MASISEVFNGEFGEEKSKSKPKPKDQTKEKPVSTCSESPTQARQQPTAKINLQQQNSRDTLVTLFTGALSIMFTQQLVSYLNDKLWEFNVWGIDSQVFALAATGIILLLLVWFGLVKQPHE